MEPQSGACKRTSARGDSHRAIHSRVWWADSEVILSSLANDAAVRSAYLEKDGVFSAAKSGTTVLEMSTISPELSRHLHEKARTTGVNLLDVAISGSTPAVDAGTITLLAGGDQRNIRANLFRFSSPSRSSGS